MNGGAERRLIDGLVGRIELALDWPEARPAGVVFVAHPHPLYGGTLDNKVAATLARAFAAVGWLSVRLNFRGVGDTQGSHDEGRGETEDFLHVIEAVPELSGVADRLDSGIPVSLAGFSFGTFVAARAARSLAAKHRPVHSMVLVGAAAGKWPMPDVRADTLLIHGERDDVIALSAVLDWARPRDLPVVVVPGADHFFHGRLTLLKRLVHNHLRGTGTDLRGGAV
jgi:alpha/beta superfamily hydrolase